MDLFANALGGCRLLNLDFHPLAVELFANALGGCIILPVTEIGVNMDILRFISGF